MFDAMWKHVGYSHLNMEFLRRCSEMPTPDQQTLTNSAPEPPSSRTSSHYPNNVRLISSPLLPQAAPCPPCTQIGTTYISTQNNPLDLSIETAKRVPQPLNDHHANNNRDKFICRICNKIYKYPGFLEAHMRNVHNSEHINHTTCEVCKQIFANQKDLKDHAISKKHLFVCNNCQLQFYTSLELEGHGKGNCQSTNIPFGQFYKCVKCGEDFRNEKLYNLHLDKVNSPRYKCPYCMDNFSCFALYRRHKEGLGNNCKSNNHVQNQAQNQEPCSVGQENTPNLLNDDKKKVTKSTQMKPETVQSSSIILQAPFILFPSHQNQVDISRVFPKVNSPRPLRPILPKSEGKIMLPANVVPNNHTAFYFGISVVQDQQTIVQRHEDSLNESVKISKPCEPKVKCLSCKPSVFFNSFDDFGDHFKHFHNRPYSKDYNELVFPESWKSCDKCSGIFSSDALMITHVTYCYGIDT